MNSSSVVKVGVLTDTKGQKENSESVAKLLYMIAVAMHDIRAQTNVCMVSEICFYVVLGAQMIAYRKCQAKRKRIP